MAHWRDGGIGNVEGSDDRPIEEWTLLEMLAEIASTPVYGSVPKCLGGDSGPAWGVPLRQIIQESFDEIVRLREAPIEAAAARTAADRNAVIKECVDELERQFSQHETSNEAQGILHAMESLEALKTPQNGGGA